MTGWLPEDRPLVAWYGDDFTGSAACMEALTFAGLPSVLFLAPPTERQAKRFHGVRGLGMAGTARAKGPEWMRENLPAVFDWMHGTGARLCHYKICSTLDSSPQLGSIGCATELAATRFGSWMPVFVAAPAIRRYQAFGNLFAAGPEGVSRLDRHPVMRCHPVTPMHEADVRLVLAEQTRSEIGLITVEDLVSPGAAEAAADRERRAGRRIVAIDTVSASDLATVGGLLWAQANCHTFAIGSQGVEYALIAHWRAQGLLQPVPPAPGAGEVNQIIVVSGSSSTVTAEQIGHAAACGFHVLRFDAAASMHDPGMEAAATVSAGLDALGRGESVLVHSVRGPSDPSIRTFRETANRRGISMRAANRELGMALGRVLAELLDRSGIRRAVVCGGDTSGQVAAQLDLFALTALAPTVPGAALYRAHSETAAHDGLELALKGGQMGSPDYFDWIRLGGGPAREWRQT